MFSTFNTSDKAFNEWLCGFVDGCGTLSYSKQGFVA